MQNLLIATKNAHKTAEFRAVLSREWQVSDLCDYPQIASPEETGETFAENASLKALSASHVFSGWVLADDSGLEVDVLGGAPGVYSARYAGVGASDADNRLRLLRELSGFPDPAQRRARFRCVLALARAGHIVERFAGACEGRIQMQEAGAGGFGYDAIFVPEGYSASFGELPSELKNQISHRARAVALFTQWTRLRVEAVGA
jgi:XTP/dITP diphosphohydrolase